MIDGFTITAGDANGPWNTPLDSINISGGGALLDGNAEPLFHDGPLGPRFNNCTFVGNRAYGAGGAIGGRNLGIQAFDCLFENNAALDLDPGTQNVGGGAMSVTGEMHVVGCTFVKNTSLGPGGAIENAGLLPTDSEELKIVNCRFLANEALTVGGGACIDWDAGYVVNCVFAGNRCDGVGSPGTQLEGGGGLRIGTIDVVNCTFVENVAEDPEGSAHGGGLLYFGDGSSVVSNCVLWGNQADLPMGAPPWTAQLLGVCCPRYCNIQDFDPSDCGTDPSIGCASESCSISGCDGVINQEPAFVDADGLDDTPYTQDDDYRLVTCSPCVDVGDPNTMIIPTDEFDVDGQPPAGEPTPDLGYGSEFWMATTTWWHWWISVRMKWSLGRV